MQLPAGTATHGVATDMDGDGKPEAVLIAGSPANLYVVDGQTGRIISQAGLDAGLIGAPAPFASGQVRGVALSLDNNTVDIRVVDGTSLRSRKLDTRITTAPLVVETSRGLLVTVGTEAGLNALDVKELQPLGRIVTENDVVQGTLSSIDLDGDNSAEVVMLTRRGRVAVVSTLDGKIKWFVEGANGAGVASFADLNSDGTLDVLVPAGQSFALGFSGHDGALIWRTEQERAATPGADAQTTRALAIAPVDAEASFLIGGEPSRTGLRAVELPKKAVVSRQ